MGYGVRQKASLALRVEKRDRARYRTDAGVKRAIAFMKDEAGSAFFYDLKNRLSAHEPFFKNMDAGGGTVTISYERPDDVTGEPTTRYGFVDEESKININIADLTTLERLFKIVLGISDIDAKDLASSIVDWRDADDMFCVPSGSAESAYYKNLTNPYEAKNADFDLLEELFLVKGMTGDIYEALKGFVTAHGGSLVNINTAPRAVLAAVGFPAHIIDQVIEFRYGRDKRLGTDDDGSFSSTSDIIPALSRFTSLGEGDQERLAPIIDERLCVNSAYFALRITVDEQDTRRPTETACVIDRNGKIVVWEER